MDLDRRIELIRREFVDCEKPVPLGRRQIFTRTYTPDRWIQAINHPKRGKYYRITFKVFNHYYWFGETKDYTEAREIRDRVIRRLIEEKLLIMKGLPDDFFNPE